MQLQKLGRLCTFLLIVFVSAPPTSPIYGSGNEDVIPAPSPQEELIEIPEINPQTGEIIISAPRPHDATPYTPGITLPLSAPAGTVTAVPDPNAHKQKSKPAPVPVISAGSSSSDGSISSTTFSPPMTEVVPNSTATETPAQTLTPAYGPGSVVQQEKEKNVIEKILPVERTPFLWRMGQWTIYWGWNRGYYSLSDIRFKGEDYNFKLKAVEAKDRPTPFSVGDYLNPTRITIPQTNLRVGYFYTDHLEYSFGVDHMKYVMRNGQDSHIDGYIRKGNAYDKTYNNEKIKLTEDFLKFEHTDGLNYINFELTYHQPLWNMRPYYFEMGGLFGGGAGVLFPKTNATMFGEKRHDDFHISGYGLGAKIGFQFLFFDHFIVQSEVKGGFISMPDIRTTDNYKDSASQHFFFVQHNVLLGGMMAF